MYKIIIDTSGIYTNVGLLKDNQLLGHVAYRVQPLVHLHETILALLTQFEITLQDVNLIAVVAGPGSWTGLNIGVVAAKTLAATLNIPLLPLSSFDVLINAYTCTGGTVIAGVDARQKRIYSALYTCNNGTIDTSNAQRATLVVDEFRELVQSQDNVALITYRQSVSPKKDILKHTDFGVPQLHFDLLPMQAMAKVMLATEADAIAGYDLFSLMPDYMQLTSPERKRLAEQAKTTNKD